MRTILAVAIVLLCIGVGSACDGCKDFALNYVSNSGQAGAFSVSENLNLWGQVEFAGSMSTSPLTGLSMSNVFQGAGKSGCLQETTTAAFTKSFQGLDPLAQQSIYIEMGTKNDKFQGTSMAAIGPWYSGVGASVLSSTKFTEVTEWYDNYEGFTSWNDLKTFDLGKNVQVVQVDATNAFIPATWETRNKFEFKFGSLT
jgi:hypothetical protein